MDLTTLARTKAYIGGNLPTTVDPLLVGLISRASDQAMQFCGRTFQRHTMTGAKLNGSGTERIMLPVNPVIDVSKVVMWNREIPEVTDAASFGYMFDQKFIYFCGGGKFDRGFRNVTVDFVAGFFTTQDAFIPTGNQAVAPTVGSGIGPDGQPMNTGGPAMIDRGVWNYDDGIFYTKVASNPGNDQYTFADGSYNFNNSDRQESIRMEYDYVPGSVEQAVLEMIGTAFERRKNLGVASRTLAGETVTYDPKLLTAAAKELLQPYRFLISP